MSKLVFLLEEPSMREALHGILPRLLPDGPEWICVAHEGKSDLQRSIPRKLRGWKEPGVRFVIIQDNDSGDCVRLKKRLGELCDEGLRPDTLIRIACQELESWYLGDLSAVDTAGLGGGLVKLQRKKKFRDPDMLGSPSGELKRLAPAYQKVSGSRAIGPHLSLTDNSSRSFQHLVSGIKRMTNELAANGPARADVSSE